jgi:integrase
MAHLPPRAYAMLLTANGEDVKTVQESLRHASSRITMDVYAQAVSSTKRHAQNKVVMVIQPQKKAVNE